MSQARRRQPLLFALICGLLAATLALPASGAPPSPIYQVTLPAADREARTALASQGVAMDAIGPETVTTIADAAELARLRKLGVEPLAVAQLPAAAVDPAYHDYAEMLTEVAQVAAAYPDITRVITAGVSLEGRRIPAIKISAVPDVADPTKPDVLFFSLTHAREHLTVEMALAVIRLFTAGYGRDPVLTNLVNTREIWVLPNVNPDGGEYDVASGFYQYWRKNRQPNGDGSYGVDLNRNYGYRWGCCGGSSTWPGSELYRGRAAFSEPETQVVRDFALAHPDIRAAITFHTYAELILYPFGYTYTDVPSDMDGRDHQAFVALAQRMAQTNGYTPQQASDLYITSGDAVDWLYGERRIFAFTFEMYPTGDPGFYPPGSVIERETQRNVAAVTYLAGMADNPRKVIGDGGDATPPTVTLTASAQTALVGQPVALTLAATDDVSVTLVALQDGGQTLAMQVTPTLTFTWTPAAAGSHVFQALAFDAGANVAAANVTVAAYLPAQASLALPDPPILAWDAALTLTFTRPITGSTLALHFDPPLGYVILSGGGTKAQVQHALFRPATAYTLTLESGFGPDALLEPAQWTFTSAPWRTYMPLATRSTR
ncbi:MAG: M14 family zinc carboxypeptidase [Chloroflexi bacterium]|nr:M14 family zinc carboxypeptidase [Chloroflexota bacterium]